jgi:2-iminobutanoate/2-iminopropanoate deaminase
VSGFEALDNAAQLKLGGAAMKVPRNPETIHSPLGGYSHQIEIQGPERMLAMAGQVGMRPDGSIPPDPIEQLQVALENVQSNLEAAGMKRSDMFKMQLFVVGEMDAPRRRAALAEWFGPVKPCSTLVFVQALAGPDLRVEIDAWASAAV